MSDKYRAENFGKNLKNEIEKQNETYYSFGLKCGLDPSGIHKFISGSRKMPELRTIIKILEATDLTFEELLK